MDFSIIILTHNCADVIGKNLKALFSQKFPSEKHEVIIIDDCSKDQTVNKIRNFIKGKRKVRLHEFKNNKGNGYCKNFGIGVSKGDFIFFIDDHIFLNQKDVIKKMYNFALRNSGFVGVCGNYVSSAKKDCNIFRDIRRFAIYGKYKNNIVLTPEQFKPFSIVISVLNRKYLFKNKNFPENFKKNAAEDIYFQIRQHKMGRKFFYLSNVSVLHSHNLNFFQIIKKIKRELSGFSYILKNFVGDEYFKKIYLPCFLSCPTLLWLSFLLSIFSGNIYIFFLFLFFLLLEIMIMVPILSLNFNFWIKLKALFYCLISEIIKPLFVVVLILRNIILSPKIIKQLLVWEMKKIVYLYENRF